MSDDLDRHPAPDQPLDSGGDQILDPLGIPAGDDVAGLDLSADGRRGEEPQDPGDDGARGPTTGKLQPRGKTAMLSYTPSREALLSGLVGLGYEKDWMPKEIQARITTVGRPLRVEVTLDASWLDRLKGVLRNMDSGCGSYPLQRYLEELIEADIVYREAISCRGPYLSRNDIVYWLQRRHAGQAQRRLATGGTRR